MKVTQFVLAASAAAIGAAGCGAGAQQFEPTENVSGKTVEGLQEAFYDLATADHSIGTVKVWSRGAYPVSHGSATVQVGFTVDNGGDTPIVFEPGDTRLDSVQTSHGTVSNVAPSSAAANLTIPPRTSQTVEMAFALPPGIEPHDVRAFRVRWTTSAAEQSYSEFTPFVATPDAAYVPVYGYYYPYAPFDYPYYDPFWRPHMRVVLVKPYPRRMIVHGEHRV